MLRKCDKNLVFLYVLDKENQFCVPTYGYYATLIDFGFAFSKDLNKGPLWPSLNHTDVGFMSSTFDKFSDPKLFLVTVSDEIYQSKNSKKSKKLLNIVKNTFSNLDINWDSGWDSDTNTCVTDFVFDKIKNKYSRVLKKYEYYWIDIIQTLITLPLKPRKTKDIDIAFKTFSIEFNKIEKVIGSHFYCLYILKGMVDAARQIKDAYLDKANTKETVDYFRSSILERIDSIASYCIPKDIHYEKLLCSLYCLAKNIEGILYEAVYDRMKEKNEAYKQLPIQSCEELLSVIDINIPHTYIFNENTKLMVINCIDESCEMKELNLEECNRVNELKSIYQGSELYEIIKNNKSNDKCLAEAEMETEAEMEHSLP
jgi:hypothetical protein